MQSVPTGIYKHHTPFQELLFYKSIKINFSNNHLANFIVDKKSLSIAALLKGAPYLPIRFIKKDQYMTFILL
jgi:hypothetical protein